MAYAATFEKIKELWTDVFYDGLGYIGVTIHNYRLSLLMHSTIDSEVKTQVEIISEPDGKGFPTQTDEANLLDTLHEIADIIEKERVASEPIVVEEYEGFSATEEAEYLGMPDIPRNVDRELRIYSWGKRHHKLAPMDSQFNVNAGLLSGKKEGLDLKNLDGRSSAIQARVVRAKMFNSILFGTVEKIERDNLTIVSVNCTAGRHRSVAFAEILQKHYYPKSVVVHMDL